MYILILGGLLFSFYFYIYIYVYIYMDVYVCIRTVSPEFVQQIMPNIYILSIYTDFLASSRTTTFSKHMLQVGRFARSDDY
jgi:hypothetical protein